MALQCRDNNAPLRLPENAAFVAKPEHTKEELQMRPLPLHNPVIVFAADMPWSGLAFTAQRLAVARNGPMHGVFAPFIPCWEL